MSVREIQQAVRRLPDAKRRRRTTWMMRAFPALAVEDLMAKGAARANSGTWVPTPPDADNIPTSATLRRAKGTAKRLGIAK